MAKQKTTDVVGPIEDLRLGKLLGDCRGKLAVKGTGTIFYLQGLQDHPKLGAKDIAFQDADWTRNGVTGLDIDISLVAAVNMLIDRPNNSRPVPRFNLFGVEYTPVSIR